MKFWTTSKRQRVAGKTAAAGLMLVLWTATLLIASSPSLHSLLHSDSQDATHHCLVTQVKEHSLLACSGTVPVPVLPPVAFAPTPCSEVQFASSFDYRLSPSRAPPSVFSSDTVAG